MVKKFTGTKFFIYHKVSLVRSETGKRHLLLTSSQATVLVYYLDD